MSPPRSRRDLLAASAGALVASSLAGCLGELGPYGGDDETEPPTESDAAPAYPPGVDADGLQDHEALLDAHRERLLENGFAIDVRGREVFGSTGEFVEVSHGRLESAPGGKPFDSKVTFE